MVHHISEEVKQLSGLVNLYSLMVSIAALAMELMIWLTCVCILIAQLCVNLYNPVNCIPQGSSVHGIFQAGILEWVAISFSRGSLQPRDQTQVSHTAGRLFTI